MSFDLFWDRWSALRKHLIIKGIRDLLHSPLLPSAGTSWTFHIGLLETAARDSREEVALDHLRVAVRLLGREKLGQIGAGNPTSNADFF